MAKNVVLAGWGPRGKQKRRRPGLGELSGKGMEGRVREGIVIEMTGGEDSEIGRMWHYRISWGRRRLCVGLSGLVVRGGWGGGGDGKMK